MRVKLAEPVLPEFLDMLEELRRTLPRFEKYEQELPMMDTLERLLSDMYTEIIVFCARATVIFRNNSKIRDHRGSWFELNREFRKTLQNLRTYARQVDEEADLVRMSRETHASETISVMKGLEKGDIVDDSKLPYRMIPPGLDERFYCRSEEVAEVENALELQDTKNELRVVAIHGMGGVGKTQLAFHYAITSKSRYDVVLWIPAETQIKMTQALATAAKGLGLPLGDDSQDDYQSALKVRDWLNSTSCRFLLVFDNVDKIDVLLKVWPVSDNGSIVITTRSPTVALKRANKTIHLQCFNEETGPQALAQLTGMEPTDDADIVAIKSICHLLGGLPLALAQIIPVFTDRRPSYDEFLSLYRRSAAKIHASEGPSQAYQHNLNTVWDLSLQNLPKDARVLQTLLSFLDPDKATERLLTNPKSGLEHKDFEFLTEEFE